MGTPDLARTVLHTLSNNPDYLIPLVVSQPDRPKGRDLKVQPTPVKALALDLGLAVAQPEKVRQPEFLEQLRTAKPDLIAVAAFGQILPQSLLDIPPYGCLNVHTSLLPKYRGAAPIQRSILNGDLETGVTIMRIEAGLDSGDILSMERTPIAAEDTSATLHDRLASIGARLLDRTIPEWVAGKIVPQPQPHELATHAPKIRKEEGWIDWSLPAMRIANLVRGLTPWPGAFTYLPAQPRPALLKIWCSEVVRRSGKPGQILAADRDGIVVGCGEDALRLTMLQREGSRKMTAAEFLAGHPLTTQLIFPERSTTPLSA